MDGLQRRPNHQHTHKYAHSDTPVLDSRSIEGGWLAATTQSPKHTHKYAHSDTPVLDSESIEGGWPAATTQSPTHTQIRTLRHTCAGQQIHRGWMACSDVAGTCQAKQQRTQRLQSFKSTWLNRSSMIWFGQDHIYIRYK